MDFLLNSQEQGVSGKYERHGAGPNAGPNAAASVQGWPWVPEQFFRVFQLFDLEAVAQPE